MAAELIGSTSGFGAFADLFLAELFPDFFRDGLLDGVLLPVAFEVLLLELGFLLFDDDFFTCPSLTSNFVS